MPVVLMYLSQPAVGRALGATLQRELGVEVVVAIGEAMVASWLASGRVALVLVDRVTLRAAPVPVVLIGDTATVGGVVACVDTGPRLERALLACVDELLAVVV